MSAGAIGSLGLAQTGAAGNGFGALNSDEFIRVMMTELSNQDPFKPQDSSALLEQMSSLRNIESQLSLQEDLASLVLQNGVASAGGMIGQVVKGLNTSNQPVQGLVTSLKIENGKPVLQLDGGATLAADRVTEVLNLGDLDVQLVQALLADLNLLQSPALIGKLVAGADADGNEIEGIVASVRIENGSAILELDSGQELDMSQVSRFSEPN